MRPTGRFCYVHTIKHIKDLSLELDELVSLVVLSIYIFRGGGRGIMALINMEATSLPHIKDFGI